MLARATESVGLEWRPPPCPEPSRLDDWFLGVARAGSQGPTPVPFFPEVHDELTGTWTAPFTARNRSSGSSSLATLDGGAARGYTEVLPVERSVAMQLCPRTASTWRGNPLLPSQACRHSSALTGSAYAACGEAASALHAMALLQVHQAKALRDLHEGGHDPGVRSELRTATDLALRATKVTARSLGRAMSTMVVQERHLWLCLADMKEVDKARFLNAPVSQTGLFSDAVENFAQQFSAAQKQTEATVSILPRHRPFLRFAFEGWAYQYKVPPLRAVPVAPCLHESSGGSPCSPERTGRAHSQLPRRLAYTSSHGALAPQAFRSTGKRANSPRCRGSVHVPRDVALPVVLLPDRRNTRHGRTGTQLAAGPSQICISPSEPSRTDSVQGQRGRGADPARGIILAYQDLVPRADAPRDSPSLADSSEEGSTDSETGHLMAPASRPLETSCLVPRRDAEVLGDLPQEVVDTITSARAPSTRHAYALKWNLFVEWCSSHREDPWRCPIRVVLSFLQQGLERRLSPSTLKVYVAAIAANHDPVEGKSLGKHDWVVRFLRGARRLNLPRPPSIPSRDLSLVLRALQQGPLSPCRQSSPSFSQ